MKLLEGKVAFITGAGSGLGAETARRFAEQGATVVIADYNVESANNVAMDIIKNGGKRPVVVELNVADREQVKRRVDDIIAEFGKIDILINNAGITRDKSFLKMTHEQWDDVLAVNLTGVFNVTKEVVPHMVKQGSGKIINTSSIVGRFGNFGQANYGVTKAGVINFTQTLARELGGKGINVNAVAFGFMKSPMTEAMPQERLEVMASQVPLKRLGTPQDASDAYLFLSCGMSDYVNGAVLCVDGGLTI